MVKLKVWRTSFFKTNDSLFALPVYKDSEVKHENSDFWMEHSLKSKKLAVEK